MTEVRLAPITLQNPEQIAKIKDDRNNNSKPSQTYLSIVHFLCGGVAGAASRTLTAPLERLKILYQVQTSSGKPMKYTGIIESLLKIGREEGWRGYMKGNGTNVIRIFPYSAVQFAAFEHFKKLMLKDGGTDLKPLQNMVAGSLAGITSVTATYPLDLIRARLSVQSDGKYKGITHAFSTIIKTEGYFAIFKGIGPTIMGVAPYVGLNFLVYESLKKYLKEKFNKNPTTWQLLISGALAGTIAQTITYPLDLLRRKMQMQGFSPDHPVYGTTWNATRTIFAQEGIPGFYRGLIPNYLKVAPAMATTFVVYENLKRFFGG